MKDLKLSTLITWAILLVLGQLLITQWTINAAGNRDVIDYVSFAGTVVGMILAILAIVYSYLANASQKSDSEALKTQITKLNDAINRADKAGDQFSEEISKLEEISNSIGLAVSHTAATLEVSTRLEAQLGQISGERAKPTPAKKQEAGAEQLSDFRQKAFVEALRTLAVRAIPVQVILYYIALMRAEGEYGELKKLKESLLLDFVRSEQKSLLSFYYDGEINGYYWVLNDLGASDDGGNILGFKKALLRGIEVMSESSFTLDSTVPKEDQKRSVEAVKLKLESEIKAHEAGGKKKS